MSNGAPASSTNRKKILITGGGGVLAAPIVRELAPTCDLVLVDMRTLPEAAENISTHAVDLTNFSQMAPLMQGVDTVIHLAVVAAKLYKSNPVLGPLDLDIYEVNCLTINPLITYHVFESARRAGVRRLVYASSLTIYFGDKTRSKYWETDYPDPQNVYACTKFLGENMGKVYHRKFGMDVLSLRIGQPYPSHPQHDHTWKTSERARSSYVTLEDVGRAATAAVYSSEKYGVFNVVSDSDNLRFDLSASARMGYVPSGRFTKEGLYHRAHAGEPWKLVVSNSAC